MRTESKLSFLLEDAEIAPAAATVTPILNGTPLVDLVETFERDHAFTPIGGYGGLIPEHFDFGPLESYFLGEFSAGSYWTEIGSIYLLECQCGEVGCWPLACKVQQTDQAVIWAGFTQPHRPERDYYDFGPFIFDAAEYREVVRQLSDDLATRKRRG